MKCLSKVLYIIFAENWKNICLFGQKIAILCIILKTGSDFGAGKWSREIGTIKYLGVVVGIRTYGHACKEHLCIYFLKHEIIYSWSN